MARRERKPLRPEDANSWEEFQARSTAEQVLLRGSTGSWKTIGLSALSGLLVLISIAFWYVVAVTPGSARWAMLVIALIPTGLLAWTFGRVMRRGFGGSKRYMELDRLRKEWQAKAERGEIPQTTPDGPKVWRDELEAGATGG
jgi:hypothetical protein